VAGSIPKSTCIFIKTSCSGLLKETMLFGHEVKKKTELILFWKKIKKNKIIGVDSVGSQLYLVR